MSCTQFWYLRDSRARSVQFQVLVNIYSVQRLYFIKGSHNCLVGTYAFRDCVVQGSNPASFIWLIRFFTMPSGMCKRPFCIFRRTHVRLPLACQVAYKCFSFTPVPQTDLKHFNLDSSLGKPWLPGKLSLRGLDCLPDPESRGYYPLRSGAKPQRRARPLWKLLWQSFCSWMAAFETATLAGYDIVRA